MVDSETAVQEELHSTNKKTTDDEKRLWGSASSSQQQQQQQQDAMPTITATTTTSTTTTTAGTTNTQSYTNVSHENKETNPPTVPFVAKKSSSSSIPTSAQQQQQHQHHHHHTFAIPQHIPPQGFELTSRVYTDPSDKLAHFDNDLSIVLPYWECGVMGSTTIPIPLQHMTIRHLLAGSKPNMFSKGTAESGGIPHPELIIALSPLEIVLNSGQVQTFQPGNVILLENGVSGGHKLQSIPGQSQQDMTVVIVTLPQHYHHLGKDKVSLQPTITASMQLRKNPCPNPEESYLSQKVT